MKVIDLIKNRTNFKLFLFSVAILLAITMIGLMGIELTRKYVDELERQKILKRVKTAALYIDGETVRAFKDRGYLVTSIEFNELRKRLVEIKEVNQDFRFVYLYEVKNEKMLFLVDAESIDSQDFSFPGEVYKYPTKEDVDIFENGVAFVEGPIKDKWGEWVSVLVPINDKQGKIVAVLGTDIDASEWSQRVIREELSSVFLSLFSLSLFTIAMIWSVGGGMLKKIKKDKTEADLQFRSILNSIDDYIYSYDLENKFLSANKALCSFLGKKEDEIVGKGWKDLGFSQEKIDEWTMFHEKVKNTQRSGKYFSRINKDGLSFFYEIQLSPIYDNNSKIIGIAGVTRDVSDENRLKEELVRSEEKFRRFFTSPLIGMAMVDHDGRWQMVNDKLCQILGYTRSELSKMNWMDVTEEECLEKQKRLLREVLKNKGTSLNFEKKYIKKDGSLVEAELSIEIIYDNEELMCMIAIIQDLTTKKKALEEKDFLQKQLNQAQKLEAIGFLAAGIAHDFNNILTGIMGYAELIKMDLPENSSYYEYLSKILSSSNRAKDLVKQIQSFTRQKNEDVQPVDIVPITKEVVNFVQSTIPAHIRVQCHIELDRIVIAIEPSKYHQVLMNMLTNAAYACREKGTTISISLKLVKIDRRPNGTHLKPDDYVLITIQDDGCGMDNHVAERIFYPFFTTKKQGEGTGMGLSVVHGIVASIGGNVEVESKIDFGTIFRIFLPLKKAECEDGETIQNKKLMGKEKILLVDDEEQILGSIGLTLRKYGYDVRDLTDSAEAVRAYESGNFDLVVTDYAMPGLDGLKMLKKIQQIGKVKVKAILCSGYAEMLNQEYMQEMGIFKTLLKPYTALELAEAIREVIDK